MYIYIKYIILLIFKYIFDYLYIIYIWFVHECIIHESYNHMYNYIKHYYIIQTIG
jgi:hypothetical protein